MFGAGVQKTSWSLSVGRGTYLRGECLQVAAGEYWMRTGSEAAVGVCLMLRRCSRGNLGDVGSSYAKGFASASGPSRRLLSWRDTDSFLGSGYQMPRCLQVARYCEVRMKLPMNIQVCANCDSGISLCMILLKPG